VLDHLDLLDERHVAVVEEAIAEGRIGFAIQGIHAINDPGQILYGECLARLTEQNGTEHPDSAFVPVLEALGEAPILDRHMLKLVLDELESDPLAVLGCNLSADNLSDPANWAHIRDQIAARSDLASRLILKVTATPPFADIALADDLLSEARDFGCRIAIDGYRCGYAIYLCLSGVKADIVKVDASFAPDPCCCHDDQGALSFLVGVAARAAPVVVVEDIETVEQLEAARLAGATHAQGYHLSTPVFSLIRKTDPSKSSDRPGGAGGRV
jgi:EAL domain-containing protein (putative c-di-GMP-specific phosphodiesterase class I)